jgi:hypothetical protein
MAPESVSRSQGDVEVVPAEDVDLVVELIEKRALGVPGDDLVQIGRVTAAEQAPVPSR